MPVTITPSDVREYLPDYASMSDTVINMYICIVDKLDVCLDANYQECDIKAIKLNAIGHFLYLAFGKMVRSQSAPSGASRSFQFVAVKDTGLDKSPYGQLLNMLDTHECFENTFNTGTTMKVRASGRRCR